MLVLGRVDALQNWSAAKFLPPESNISLLPCHQGGHNLGLAAPRVSWKKSLENVLSTAVFSGPLEIQDMAKLIQQLRKPAALSWKKNLPWCRFNVCRGWQVLICKFWAVFHEVLIYQLPTSLRTLNQLPHTTKSSPKTPRISTCQSLPWWVSTGIHHSMPSWWQVVKEQVTDLRPHGIEMMHWKLVFPKNTQNNEIVMLLSWRTQRWPETTRVFIN